MTLLRHPTIAVPTRFVTIDTETTGLYRHKGHHPFAAAAVFPNGETRFWRNNFTTLRPLIEDPSIDKVFHNAKFDWGMLETLGFRMRGKVWDTGILVHLLDGRDALGASNLDAACRKYLPRAHEKVVSEITDWFKKHKIPRARWNFQDLPHELLKRRCIGDTQLTHALFCKLFKTVADTFPYLLDIEHRLIPIVLEMERRGICVNYAEIEAQRIHFESIVEDVTRFCEGVLNWDWFNINSPIHQRALLEEAGILHELTEMTKPAKNRKSTKPFKPNRKLGATNLLALHHPVAHMLLIGKAAQKMISPFLSQARELSVDGVLHCNYKQTGTVSGRFSCTEPNLQNIPVDGERRASYTEDEALEAYEMTGHRFAPHIKRIFTVRPGYAHIHMDKRQAEMFALGHYSQDRTLLSLLQQEESVHDGMCKLMFNDLTKGLKQRSKAVTFGYQYGAGLAAIAKRVKGSITEARSLKNRLAHILPGLPKWRGRLEQQIVDRGYVVTDSGRRHYLNPGERYIAVNRMCQGHVGDELKSRMVVIGESLLAGSYDARILLNIHDELVIECSIQDLPDVGPLVFRHMNESDIRHEVPIPSDMEITYTRWADLLPVKDPYDSSTYPSPPGN